MCKKNKEPWGAYPHIWKNSTAFFTYLRGSLRKAWNNNPVKNEYKKRKRKQIDNPNPKGKKATVWGFECEMCHNNFVMKECQVDHINPAGRLSSREDIQGFVERLLWVTDEDLRLVCKKCNSTLAYADRQNITFDEAVIEKRIIELCKMSVSKQNEILTEHNMPCNNASVRKESFRKLIQEKLI